ncbi:tetratricopeptide repeat-containing response regulator [Marinobacter oulmenensis]|uniref:Tetratricopeptide (TPR) repeat protein n=1 Tax=Marinobacter oulmenensis TaxID=643747 RepID=A0A840UPQ4_9GAMM|nr:tetratricopeptide repeat-containing response regulator [Marinobacter oulmenensis]MBB5322827.1 tetratricopeptide (TPR) repeat protein [Marinobacter oulmenensis]
MNQSDQKELANPFRKLNFLVVDDFENFRLSMRQMLRSCGADKIELVAHATPAIQYCAYNHVDVVLCDYNLGEGKNGQNILEELRYRKLLKHSSLFLMVTAETSKEMVMGAREYQPDAYLTKPINRAVLEKRLGALIRQRNALLPITREIDRENYPEAISLCLDMLPKQPRYKTWLMKTLGELYYQVGDMAHAQKVYDEVLGQRELSWARLGRCRVLAANQKEDQAIAELKTLIEKHPDYMEAYDLLAQVMETQGKTQPAQQVLERASRHSPNALLRHKHLAELADANQDIDTASEAWRQTVSLGSYSVHDHQDHYLALAQSLSDLSEGDTGDQGASKANEAFNILSKMEKRFPDDEQLPLKSRIVQCRLHAGQGHQAKAEKLLNELSSEIDELPELGADLGLDYAKTLFRMGRDQQAKELLGQLASQYEDDNSILQKIEGLLDEPVGFRQKIEARGFNQEGIKAFEAGDLHAAVTAFNQALNIVPDHAALNLNLVQVLLKQYEQQPENRSLLDTCQKRLARLESLPEQHRQYRRYQALSRKLKGLMT